MFSQSKNPKKYFQLSSNNWGGNTWQYFQQEEKWMKTYVVHRKFCDNRFLNSITVLSLATFLISNSNQISWANASPTIKHESHSKEVKHIMRGTWGGGGSEYHNTTNKIEQTPHHHKRNCQHTDTMM